MSVSLRCEGCGWRPDPLAPRPFTCPRAGLDEADHVVAPGLELDRARWAPDGDPDPFVRYRALLHAHALALRLGLTDADYVALARRLGARVAAVEGRGFGVTPLARGPAMPACEAPWVKDETVNVSGSHKGRHLAGLLLHLEVLAAAGQGLDAPLAIASCGNAALAAAVLARAAGRRLDVYVPPDAHPRVMARLAALGAVAHVCHRREGEAGDPCVAAFREAVRGGALPFACQGTDNGLTLDGGRTLAWELAESGVAPAEVFVQVGGGALASSLARGLAEAVALGAMPSMPRVMAVQGRAVAPLAAAWERLVADASARWGRALPDDPDLRAATLAGTDAAEASLEALREHRARFLRPWPSPASSVAHGLLDDEAYDGAAVLRAVVRTGARVLAVDEETLREAEALGGGRADATGTAGLAGLLAWSRERARPAATRVVLFTGAPR